MNDVIRISGLELWTRVGTRAAERSSEQRVLVSVEMCLDAKRVAKADDVKKGIDYEAVLEEIQKLAGKERKTLERLAEDVASAILKKFKPASMRATVTKFPLPGVADISLTITRSCTEASPR